MLLDLIWSMLIKVSLLFQIVYFALFDLEKVQEIGKNVAIMWCGLEKFPLAFINSMENLLVHLPYETIIRGLV